MRPVFRFLTLPRRKQALLVRAFLLLAAVRAALKYLPLPVVRQRLRSLRRPGTPGQGTRRPGIPRPLDREEIDRIAAAVEAVSPYVPGARCLAQAVTLETMLYWRNCPASLALGFAPQPGGSMIAHAWVEYQGEVILGGRGGVSHYVRFPLSAAHLEETGLEKKQG